MKGHMKRWAGRSIGTTWRNRARGYAAGLALAAATIGALPFEPTAPPLAIVRMRRRRSGFDPVEVVAGDIVLTLPLGPDGSPTDPWRGSLN